VNQSIDLSPFDKHSKKKWIDGVSQELKGQNPLDLLAWTSEPEIFLSPIYFQKDLEKNINIIPSSGVNNSWLNLAPIHLSETASNWPGLKTLNHYCDGYLIDCDNPVIDSQSFAKLIGSKKQMFFSNPSFQILDELSKFDNIEPVKSLGLDPVWDFNSEPGLHEFCKKIFEKPIISNNPGMAVINIQGNRLVDAGSSIVQELGVVLSQLVEYYQTFIELGIPKNELVNRVEITTSVGQNYFHEIAKLRAIKILSNTVRQAYGIKTNSPIKINASTSIRYKSLLDAENNLIRDSTEAMACVIGGCDTLTVKPFETGTRTKHSARVALNVSNLLKSESFMNRVIDPSAGSYYIESLTKEIVAKGWGYFLEIEKRGGFLKTRSDGWLDEEIAKHKAGLQQQMSDNAINMIGVNKYRNEGNDAINASSPNDVFRLAAAFELDK